MSDWNQPSLGTSITLSSGWTVPMSDWNIRMRASLYPLQKNGALNRTYEWLKPNKAHYWVLYLVPKVEPYLWVIETGINQSDCVVGSEASWTVPMSDWNSNSIPVCIWNSEKLNRTYEWLKPDWDPSGRRPSFRVEPYLWVICCFCWTHCFIRILWIVSLIFKENTNKKMLQLIKSWSFFVKKFWLQDVGMYLQWRRCCPREIREMLLIISVWKRMGVALMVCRFLSWRINGRLIMSR